MIRGPSTMLELPIIEIFYSRGDRSTLYVAPEHIESVKAGHENFTLVRGGPQITTCYVRTVSGKDYEVEMPAEELRARIREAW